VSSTEFTNEHCMGLNVQEGTLCAAEGLRRNTMCSRFKKELCAQQMVQEGILSAAEGSRRNFERSRGFKKEY
jgi:hypothetical protein